MPSFLKLASYSDQSDVGLPELILSYLPYLSSLPLKKLNGFIFK
jgi:hypothetical protein